MDVPQSIGITHAGQPSLTLTVLEESRIRFYATVVSDQADGPGWAQAPDGHYWRLDVPPSVYHALTAGDACGVLWRGTTCLAPWTGKPGNKIPTPPRTESIPRSLAGISRRLKAKSPARQPASPHSWAVLKPIQTMSGGWWWWIESG